MPRSRTPSPYAKSRTTDKNLRAAKSTSSRKRSPVDKTRSAGRSSRRSRSPSSKTQRSRKLSPAVRVRSRRSRSKSPRRRGSPSKSNKSSRNYPSSSSRRRSRSNDSSYRKKSSKSRRRHDSSSSSSSTSETSSSSSSRSSSRSKSPVVQRPSKSTKDQYIPLTKELPKTKRLQSPPRTTFASVDQLLDNPIMPETLDNINADDFVSRTFTSKKMASDKVIINLDRETVTVPKAPPVAVADDPIFYPNLYADDNIRMDKWIKKLFVYRQKAFLGN